MNAKFDVIDFSEFAEGIVALIDLNTVHPSMRTDYATRNENLQNGKALCENCDGTGNNMFYMYQACPKCNGRGYE